MRKAATATLVAILASTPAVAQSGETASNWEKVVACVASAGTAERHACIDQVLRTAGVLDPVRETAQQRADFGRPQRSEAPASPAVVAPVAAAPVAAPPAAASASQAQAPETVPAIPAVPERIDRIATTIAAARLGGNGKLLVATAEATVWRQVDGETFRIAPAAGTPFAVGRGALGSYICTVGRGNSFRCTRVD